MWWAPLPWGFISFPFLPPGENWVGIVLINYTVRAWCLYQHRQGWTSVPHSWKERCWGLWLLWSPELVSQQRTSPRESSGFGLRWAYPSMDTCRRQICQYPKLWHSVELWKVCTHPTPCMWCKIRHCVKSQLSCFLKVFRADFKIL